MAFDRRKPIHHISRNVSRTLELVHDAFHDQITSGDLMNWPDTLTSATQARNTLATLKTDLDTWYTTWRDKDPVEPFQPSFLGVFGTEAAFTSNLEDTSSVVRVVRNDYTALSMLAMAYEDMASIGIALSAEAPGLETLALDGLADIVAHIETFSETMCTATVRDLHNQDSTIPMSNAATAITATQAVWNA